MRSPDDDKRLAAEAAVAEVGEGMLIGLGTGSTAAHAIQAIGRAGMAIDAVATSEASARLARQVGIKVVDFARVDRVDLTIDGVDEIDDGFRAIKGAGGAMLREKIVAAASDRMVVIADGSKKVAAIGGARLPVEVVPFATAYVSAALRSMFCAVHLRDGGKTLTDNGNIVLDCMGAHTDDWDRLAGWLSTVPGVVGHGLFLSEIDAAYISALGIVTRLERRLASR
ncbi:ribose-5-phosphate isomerase RpiA [Sphingomonas sp. BT553]|uniref:Ribose-5-phosphate isomerase A n=2 Tax=Sphingomonas mollis TaxID=2795726 RepID=A0ABS0XKP6_9SPHN|nr:ribose-5-phosphate isomerase RpiA [Sphingomonas sp. BT553]MBJ6120602.1 ribose-5-phosphate isomerase RpiA [Sphingomonas sp. BT553]